MRIPFVGEMTFARTKPKPEEELARGSINGSIYQLVTGFQSFSDDLTGSKGATTYSKMKTDAQVQAALNQIYAMVLGDGWDVACADVEEGDKTEAERQADFVRYCFEESQGSFEDNLLDMLDAIALGWSILEIVWRVEDGQKWDGFFGLKALKSKDTLTCELNVDEFGNVLSVRQPSVPESLETPYPVDKFLIFTNRSPYGNPFGESDLRAAYKAWWLKDWVQRWFAVFMQRAATPTPYGKYAPGITKTQQTEVLTILDKLQSETAMVIPNAWEVDFLQVAAGSHEAYLRCLEWCNQEIAKAILSQTLTSGEGQRVGSMALGNVHLDILRSHIRVHRGRLQETVNDQLIRRLVDANFEIRHYPKLEIVAPQAETTNEYFEAIFRANNLSVDVIAPEDVPQLRDRLGLTAAAPEQLPELGPLEPVGALKEPKAETEEATELQVV